MAKTLTGIGTDLRVTGAVAGVYVKVFVPPGTGSPPYNFTVKSGSETLFTSTDGPTSWSKLTTPTGGWTVEKVKELSVSGDQMGTYLTQWADTSFMVVGGPFSASDSGAFFAFFYP